MKLLTRLAEPSKLDTAPYKTIVKVSKDNEHEIFMQRSKDEDVPDWLHVGTIYAKDDQEAELLINKLIDTIG